MKASEIRKLFLKYFEDRGHRIVPSLPVVPVDDPTLLFTNAGMNQFKDIFLGKEQRDYVRATSSQKCIRAGGKHNDLEDVGKDNTHLTFFEMLGNWSFGDYYQEGAIAFAWEFLTQLLGLPKDRLWATIYLDDDEAEAAWRKVTGIPLERIRRYGKKDNFWEMGDVGPCGPCSEIHLDLGVDKGCGRSDCLPNCPHCEAHHLIRYLELWNLVFIQYDRDESGTLHLLPDKHVDTGLGFERTTGVLQGTYSIYDTDLFLPIMERTEELTGVDYRAFDQTPFKVLADHIRTLSFAIADEVIPSNEGRGYVLRRILRRAARFGRNLGMHEPFIYKLVPTVVDIMGEAYPELGAKANHVALVIKGEEETFGKTLDRGLEIFEAVVARLNKQGQKTIPGEDVFKLYDTYGFPLDLTQLMAEERGFSVDVQGFNKQMDQQRARAREGAKTMAYEGQGELSWTLERPALESSAFIGYETFSSESTVVKLAQDGDGARLVLDRTPFYAEAGGQVGDTGTIHGNGVEIRIDDTLRTGEDIVHYGQIVGGVLDDLPERVTAQVAASRRRAIMRNHSATHLLHEALREVLGDHVNQSGSLVAPNRLRFDFTHFAAIDRPDLEQIERIVNARIRDNLEVQYFSESLEKAKAMGAAALFGEKYGETVRVLKMGDYSLELCGGTHVSATGEIGQFMILSEGGIAAGIRRIEALTGEQAEERALEERRTLRALTSLLNASTTELVDRVDQQLEHNKALEKTLKALQQQLAGSEIDALVRNATMINGFKVVAASIDAADMKAFRKAADVLRNSLGSGVGVLGTAYGDKVSLLAVVTDDLIKTRGLKAGDIVQEVAREVGGGGGGRPHMAQAGGRDPAKLERALSKVIDIVRDLL